MQSGGTMNSNYRTRAKLWKYPGAKASWYFLTLPRKLADEIRLVDAGPRRTGFGSLRVQATIGGTAWSTSLFPSVKDHSYLLPIKAQVRKKEQLVVGKMVALQLEVKRAW
jgi:hypothetical protein